MAGIKGKDTRPELLIRRHLHRLGFRYRIHDPRLPGKPDLVLPKWNAAIFVHGCFWHGHGCPLFKWPSTREAFWKTKISRNREKDAEVIQALVMSEWRVLVVWECALKGRGRRSPEKVAEEISTWLHSGLPSGEIQGE